MAAQTFTFAATGDSLTHGVAGTVTQDEAYPALLNNRRAEIVVSNNVGVHGDTTAKMLVRKWDMFKLGRPNILTIYGGTNDLSTPTTVQASPTPTATVFAVEAGKGVAYPAGTWLTVAGEQSQVLSVATDTITLTSALAAGAPAAGAAVEMDTRKNLAEIALFAKAQGCTRIAIVGLHYFNFTAASTGIFDTVSAESARNGPLRVKQAAAAADAGVVYVDLYDWMRDLIVAGTYTQGDCLWHIWTNDQHLSEAGHAIVADALEATFTAQGWVA
jgi:lysophospholipase L1-like esterase